MSPEAQSVIFERGEAGPKMTDCAEPDPLLVEKLKGQFSVGEEA